MFKAQPYELQEREVNKQENNMVKNKDGKDISEEDEKIEDKQTEMEDRQTMKEDGLKDAVEAKYFKMEKGVLFRKYNLCRITVSKGT